jgi:hypothetical protein
MSERAFRCSLSWAFPCAVVVALCALSGCAPGGPGDITNATVNAWVDRVLAPRVKKAPRKTRTHRYYIDVATLAHRHPAWQLADAIAKKTAPAAPHMSAPGAMPALPPPALAAPFVSAHEISLPAETITLGVDARSARATQSAYGDKFLDSVKRRQVNEALQEDALARQALEEEIAEARRATLARLDPTLLPDEVQLRLTNLRLQLLVARLDARRDLQLVRVAPQAEQEAVESRIDKQLEDITNSILEIETKWNAQLRAQEKEQQSRVAHAFEVVPREMRVAGEARIAAQSQERKAQRIATRDEVARTNEALLQEDFTTGSLNLSVRLPAARRIALKVPPAGITEKNQTLGQRPSSLVEPLPAIGALGLQVPARQAEIAKLREQATSDATRFARLAALKWGGVYTTDRRAQNRTRQAIRLLFGDENQGEIGSRKSTAPQHKGS